MGNLITTPIEDNFETTLSQAWNGLAGTIYVNNIPSSTLPSGEKTYVVVNPGKSTQQVARISGWTTGQLTCDSVAIEKGAGLNYTSVTHAVQSKVIISDNYQFWKDIKDAINSKAGTDSNNTWTGINTFDKVIATGYIKDAVYADSTARDTAIPTPTNGMRVYNTAVGLFQKYQAGAWTDDTGGASTPNASTTVAGKVEKATPTQITNGTSTGETGAELFVGPADLKTVTDAINTSIGGIGGVTSTLGETLTAGNVVSTDPDTGKIVRTYGQGASVTAISYGGTFSPTAVQSISVGTNTVVYLTTTQIAGGFPAYFVSAGTVSGNVITMGSSSNIAVSPVTSVTSIMFGGIVKLDTNSFVVVYGYKNQAGGNYEIYARAGTVSGTTITYGSQTSLVSVAGVVTRGSVTVVDTNKFVVNYAYGGNNKLMTGTVSGTTITMGGEQTGFAFLSTVGTYVSANKIALSDGSNIRLYTFSGYIATEGNNLAIGTTYTNYSIKDIGSSKSIFSGTNSSNSFAFIVDCSGTTPTKGTTVTVLNSSTTNDCCKVSNNQVCIVTGNNKYYFYNYSGTTLSPENNYTGTYNITSFNGLNYLNSGMLIGSYTDSSNQIGHIVSNRIHTILGILQSSGVLNDVKVVKTSGGQSTIHTSLQPGRNIYLNNDGTLVYETGTYIGKTQSDTSILVGINYSGL